MCLYKLTYINAKVFVQVNRVSVFLQHVHGLGKSGQCYHLCFWGASGFLWRGGWILRYPGWRQWHRALRGPTGPLVAGRGGGWWALAVSLPPAMVRWGFSGCARVSARGACWQLKRVRWRRYWAAVARRAAAVGGACFTHWRWFGRRRILRMSSAGIYSLYTPTSMNFHFIKTRKTRLFL